MDKIINVTHKSIRMIVALMMGALVLMVFSQVVLRFLFASSLVWVEELGRFVFMWLMFLGITVGVAQVRHIQVTLLVDRCKGVWRKAIQSFGLFASAAFFGFLTKLGFDFAAQNLGGESALLEMNLGYVYAVLPLAAVVCLIYILNQLVGVFQGKEPERRDAGGHDSVC